VVASFVVDEDMSRSLARALRDAGHEAIHVREAGLQGAPDGRVFDYAQTREAVLITEDVGFGDIRKYPLGHHAGIMVVRIPETVAYPDRIERVMEVVRGEVAAGLSGCLLVIDLATVRRREP